MRDPADITPEEHAYSEGRVEGYAQGRADEQAKWRPLTFYHATSEEAWAAIKAEKILWGVRPPASRCTYLSVKREDAEHYGKVILEVRYTPGSLVDNYCDGCWQCRVYRPIPIEAVRRVDIEEEEDEETGPPCEPEDKQT